MTVDPLCTHKGVSGRAYVEADARTSDVTYKDINQSVGRTDGRNSPGYGSDVPRGTSAGPDGLSSLSTRSLKANCRRAFLVDAHRFPNARVRVKSCDVYFSNGVSDCGLFCARIRTRLLAATRMRRGYSVPTFGNISSRSSYRDYMSRIR